MSLFLGNSGWAVSTVVASFMAGLAAGSFLGGKVADRFSKNALLKLYIFLEIGIAVSALFSRPVIGAVQNMALTIGILTLPFWLQSLIWFMLGFCILLIPTVMMGATLPVLARWFINSCKETGSIVGRLYAVNTLGAVVGVGITGFYLLQYLGISRTFWVASGINIFCAVVVMFVSKINAPVREIVDQGLKKIKSTPSLIFKKQLFIPFILLFSGIGAMVCQIIWTRTMVLVIGSSTYAFTIILFTFLLGICIGSAVCSYVLKKCEPSWIGVGFISGIIAVVIIMSLPLYNRLPYLLVRLYNLVFQNLIPITFVHLFVCMTVMLLPTVLMGALFPLTIASAVKDDTSIGLHIGSYSMVAIFGNIIGSLAAGFIFIPTVGTETGLIIAVGFYTAASITAWIKSRYIHTIKIIAVSLIIISLGVIIRPRWNIPVLVSGAFLYGPQYLQVKSFETFFKLANRYEILYHKDGYSSTITVLQDIWGDRFLRVNGKTDASWGYDMETQLLLAYYPRLIYQGQPDDVLIIGLGSGVTAGACGVDKHIKTIDCIEIEPAVSKAAMFFTKVNKWVMKDPRFNLIHTDARHYLTGSRKKYDLIISEPSNPWMAGVATLYTKEAFELVNDRLRDNGIFCQWIHSYSMGERDFKMILATFASVFPHMMLATPKENDFLILGSRTPIVFNYPAIENLLQANPEMTNDLSRFRLAHPFTLIATTFVLDDEDVRAYVKNAEILYDDRLTLEFSAPHYLHKGEDIAISLHLQEVKKNFLPKNLIGLDPTAQEWALLYNLAGEAFMRLKNAHSAELLFKKAHRESDSNARTITNLGRIASIRDKDFRAEELYKKAIGVDPQYHLAYFHLGKLYAIQGLEEKGITYLEKGMILSPQNLKATLALGPLYVKYNRLLDAKNLYENTLSSSYIHSKFRYQLEQALSHVLKKLTQQ